MSAVQVTYTWPEGGTLSVAVQGKSNYPDALDELRIQAQKAWADAWAAMQPADEDAERQ